MKNLFTSIAFLLVSNFAFGQNEWATQGTKWWYYFKFDLASPVVTEYESVGQTTIAGKTCHIITATTMWDTTTIYTYEENGKVYNANANDSIFQLRYDFNAQIGDTWINTVGVFGNDTLTFHVDTILTMMIAGETYQSQNVTTTLSSQPFNSAFEWVLVGIGSKENFDPPYPTDITVEGFPGLGCYLSPETGLISLGNILDCQELLPVGFILENTVDFTISPNPTEGSAILNFSQPPGTSATVQIFNSYGQKIQEHRLQNVENSLQLNDLQPGLNFVVLQADGMPIKTKKLLRF